MSEFWVTVLSALAVSLVGSGGIAWALISKYAERRVDHAYKKAEESYRATIASRFDRISRIHEREFEVLPQIWHALLDVSSALGNAIAPYPHHLLPDLNSLSDERLELSLRKHRVGDDHIEGFMKSDAATRRRTLSLVWRWGDLTVAGQRLLEFERAYKSNRIFLGNELREALERIYRELRDFWESVTDAVDLGDSPGLQLVQSKFLDTLYARQELVSRVGDVIQTRLAYHEAYRAPEPDSQPAPQDSSE